jgi:hypothetical protein
VCGTTLIHGHLLPVQRQGGHQGRKQINYNYNNFGIMENIYTIFKKFFICSFPLMEKNTPVGAQTKRSSAD